MVRKLIICRFISRLIILAPIVFITACANIPPDAAYANVQVSTGIERLNANTQTILDAYRQSLREALRNQFESVHAQAEQSVRKKHNIDKKTALDDEQCQEVSGLVLIIFEKAYDAIDQKISKVKSTVQGYATTIKTANDSITEFLEKANQPGLAQSQLIQLLSNGELVSPDLSDLKEHENIIE